MNQKIELNLAFSGKPIAGKLIRFGKFNDRWNYSHALLNIIGLFVFLQPGLYPLWLALLSISFMIFILNLRKSLQSYSYPLKGLGYPNMITTVRLVGIMLLAFYFNDLSSTALFIMFNIVILMDGIDGLVARKLDQCSLQGERFDSEVDAQLVCLLSWIHFTTGAIGWWILIPGMMRYFYQIFFFWVPSGSTSPPKRFRATVAVIFFFSLSFAFLLESSLASYFLMFSSSLILLSFGWSLYNGLIQYFQPKSHQ